MVKFSFEKAYYQLAVPDRKKVKSRIMEVLGIASRPSWIARLRGDIEPKISEARKIEEIFSEYGITDIWN